MKFERFHGLVHVYKRFCSLPLPWTWTGMGHMGSVIGRVRCNSGVAEALKKSLLHLQFGWATLEPGALTALSFSCHRVILWTPTILQQNMLLGLSWYLRRSGKQDCLLLNERCRRCQCPLWQRTTCDVAMLSMSPSFRSERIVNLICIEKGKGRAGVLGRGGGWFLSLPAYVERTMAIRLWVCSKTVFLWYQWCACGLVHGWESFRRFNISWPLCSWSRLPMMSNQQLWTRTPDPSKWPTVCIDIKNRPSDRLRSFLNTRVGNTLKRKNNAPTMSKNPVTSRPRHLRVGLKGNPPFLNEEVFSLADAPEISVAASRQRSGQLRALVVLKPASVTHKYIRY